MGLALGSTIGTPVVSPAWTMTTPLPLPSLPDISPGLEDFALDAASRTSLESLRDLLTCLPDCLVPLARCASLDHSHPTRRVLVDSPGLRIELRGWLPGQSTLPHDHGVARCAFRVLSGIAVESRYDRDAQGQAVVIACDHFLTGSVLVCEPGHIHSIANDASASEPLVTLHVFSLEPSRTSLPANPQV